jgi:predicted permease
MARWWAFWRNLLRRESVESDLDREVESYFDLQVERLAARGLSIEEAKRAVRAQLGAPGQVKERVRDIRAGNVIETTFQDLRYAIRTLRKTPAFTLTSVLSLALAIGANTAIYSIVDAALLRPLPVPEPDRLFTLTTLQIQEPGKERPLEDVSWSYPVFQQFRAAAGDSARLALFNAAQPVDIQIPNKDAPIEKAYCQYVSGDAFEIMGIPPALGRVFTSAEDRTPWGHPYLVISYDYWQRRFQGDPSVLGRHVQIGRHFFTIVGVARKGFFGVEPGKFADIWMPAMMYSKAAFNNPTWGWFRIFGRLAPGTTLARLRSQLDPVFRAYESDLMARFPMTPAPMQRQYRDRPLLIHPAAAGASNFQRDFARPLWVVLCAGGGLLLIACANIASLLMARGAARAGEIAMRVSLGATRSRVIRQLLTESLLLSFTAGLLGWLIAQAGAPALIAMLSESQYPVRFALSMDTRVLLFCAAVSSCATVLFGLIPAWRASATGLTGALHGARTTASRLVLGRAFTAIQAAFAFVLIIAGTSFLFSLRNLMAVDTGFNPHHVIVAGVSTELSDVSQKPELNVFLDELQRRIEALPGVQAAAIGGREALFQGSHTSTQVIVPGRQDRQEYTMAASPRYFTAMQLPLLAGREFEPADRDYRADGLRQQMIGNEVLPRYFGNEDPAMGPRPTIVNQAFAKRYYGNENPLGKVFRTPDSPPHEIIGVVANAPYGSLREGPQPIIYFIARGTNYVDVYIRTGLDQASVMKMVERELEAMGHGTRVRDVAVLDMLIGDTVLRERLLAGIGGAFAFLGLLLAAIGLFGLLNYSVERRTKEIGIRAALGARAFSIAGLVIRDLAVPTAGGIAAGLACSLVLMQYVQSVLFGVQPADPHVMVTGAVVFLCAALAAGGLPAWRAAAIDPITALRHQ